MPKVPFSHLTPSPKPGASAVGESGYHLPLMPFLSGQEAVDSLIGYYPSKRRMDSALNPHTYQKPQGVRSTTMPNTKVASLLKAAKLARRARRLAEIDPAKSQLVAGFITKCAEAGYGYNELADACAAAMASHPAIADEFEKCGFIKQAFGSVNMSIPGYNAPIHSQSSAERWAQSRKPKYRPAPSSKIDQTVQVKRMTPPTPTPGTPTPQTPSQPWYQLPKPDPNGGPSMLDHLARQGMTGPQQWTPSPSGTPSRASLLTGNYPPQQWTNAQGQMGLMVPSTKGNPGGWLSPEQVPQYQAVQKRLAEWNKARAGAGEDHPYFSYWNAPGERNPETIPERLGYGSFRTSPEGFNEDYQGWLNTISPENQEVFMQTAKDIGIPPEQLVRAMAAEEFIRSKVPYAHGPIRQQAEEAFWDGKLKEQPNHPGYAERMRAFNQLPEDFQKSLMDWQRYQIDNWRSQNPWGNDPQFSSPTAWIGSGDGNDWYFPAQPEYRSQMFDAQGNPQLLDPEKYMGLQELADRYGVDLRNEDFRKWWAQAQKENPGGDDWWTPPGDLVKSYWWDRERRRGNHDFDKSEDGAFAQRMFGFRRTDPRTGREVFTVGDDVGRHPGGLGGALKDTVLGGLSAPATAGISLAEGDPRYAQMGGRSTLALFNHLLGADLGWNSNINANPDGFAKGQAGHGTEIGQNIPTTRSLFGATYDPITGEYKMSDFDSVGTYYNERANNPDTSWGDRILSRGMATTMDKGDDVLYNMAIMRGLGLKPGLHNFQLTSAASQSLPNLIDPNAAPDRQGLGRFTGAGGDAARGYFLPFSGNPLFTMAGQGFKEIPGTKHYFDTADRLRYHTAANEDLPYPVRWAGEGTANTMEILPEMLLTGQLTRNLGKNNPIAQVSQIPARQAFGWSALGGFGHASPTENPELFRKQTDFRLGLDRDGQMRFDQANKQMANMVRLMSKGIELPEGYAEQIDLNALMPEQRDAMQKLLAMPAAERATALQSQGFAGPATQSPSRPQLSPNAPQMPQADILAGEGVDQALQIVQQMSPAEQQVWMKQLQQIETAYTKQFMDAGANLPPEQLQELARQEAMRTLLQQIMQTQQQRQPFRVQLREKTNFDMKAPQMPKIPGAPPAELPTPPPVPQLPPDRIYGALNQGQQQPPPQSPTPPSNGTQPPTQPPAVAPQPPTQANQPPKTPVEVDRQKMQGQQPNAPAQPPAQQPAQQPAPQSPANQPPASPPEAGGGFDLLSMIPSGQDIMDFVFGHPEEAQKMSAQAAEQAKGVLAGSPETQALTEQALQTGEVPEPMAQKAVAAWTDAGYDVETAYNNFNNMDLPSKLILGAGLGLGVLGLVQAMSGEGGVGSWLMGALGLGTAAFMGGQAGLFDQGAMDLTGGLSQATGQMFGPGESGQQQPINPLLQKGLQGFLSSDLSTSPNAAAGLQPMMGMIPEPIQQQLDMAAGHGSWGNKAMSWLGDITGQRQRLMQDRLGLNPQQQDRLLNLWSQMRSQPQG